jgi:hypothetical protein
VIATKRKSGLIARRIAPPAFMQKLRQKEMEKTRNGMRRLLVMRRKNPKKKRNR